MKQRFTIGQILSVYTGKLMCDISDLYKIANFLMDDNLFTHQLPRAAREAKPWLLESLPWLSGLTLDEVTAKNWKKRLQFYSEQFGEFHELAPIPSERRSHRDPVEEANEMASGRVIVVEGAK